ncbi:Protein of unknown function [Bacillus wiedmannii]|uniref:Uncharacterized protein n=1 Tax=Bacillus wiedmannii TaxID=1890302 RepID=A0AB37YPW3_9BACI|nr:Protein of unknown function [Bacillus wiedmannii]
MAEAKKFDGSWAAYKCSIDEAD